MDSDCKLFVFCIAYAMLTIGFALGWAAFRRGEGGDD